MKPILTRDEVERLRDYYLVESNRLEPRACNTITEAVELLHGVPRIHVHYYSDEPCEYPPCKACKIEAFLARYEGKGSQPHNSAPWTAIQDGSI